MENMEKKSFKIIRIKFLGVELEEFENLQTRLKFSKPHDLIRHLVKIKTSDLINEDNKIRTYGRPITEGPAKMTKIEKTNAKKLELMSMSALDVTNFLRGVDPELMHYPDGLDQPDSPGNSDIACYEIVDKPERGRVLEKTLYEFKENGEKKITGQQEICGFSEVIKNLVSKKLI